MKKIILIVLLTLSSLSFGADEHKYEAVVNPNEMGVYLIDQINGKVKFCQAVSDDKEMVTGCTEWSGVWGLAPNPLQQQFMNELLNQ